MENTEDYSFFYKSECPNHFFTSRYAEFFLSDEEMDYFLKNNAFPYFEEITENTNLFLSKYFNTTVEELKKIRETCGAKLLPDIPILFYAYDNISADLFFIKAYAKSATYSKVEIEGDCIENFGILATVEK